MLEPSSSGAPVFPSARLRAAEALLRERGPEIVAAVVRQAEAGDRAALRLARKHGLSIWPAPDVLAARLAESIERTRATVATLLAEGGLHIGKDSPLRRALRPPPIRPADDCPFRCESRTSARAPALHGSEGEVELVNNNENTSAEGDGDAASFGRTT